MAIPLATTTIAVLRLPDDATRDPYEAQPEPAVAAAGIRAHFSSPRGNEVHRGGQQSEVTDRLGCDLVDLRHTDQVRDETTGDVYDVVWVRTRRSTDPGMAGLDHIEAGVRRVTGLAVSA